MNKDNHRLIFNASRGCMMAVAETANSSTKSPSGASKARRRSSKCSKSAKSDGFTSSKNPPGQWIRVRKAPIFIVNSGTIAGRTVLNLAANNLQNIGGILNANKVSVNAATDINNTGGRIAAQNALALTAGRDINILSTSQSSATQIGASSFSRTSIDRIAGLYVTNPGGTLVAETASSISKGPSGTPKARRR